MKLITAHRILIGAGIAFFFFYAAVLLRHYATGGTTGELIQAAASTAIAIGLIAYYRTLKRWGRTPRS